MNLESPKRTLIQGTVPNFSIRNCHFLPPVPRDAAPRSFEDGFPMASKGARGTRKQEILVFRHWGSTSPVSAAGPPMRGRSASQTTEVGATPRGGPGKATQIAHGHRTARLPGNEAQPLRNYGTLEGSAYDPI